MPKGQKKSAQLITQGFMKCLEEKNFFDITISDIQRASTVGRSTFYRLFDNTGDVLVYLCDQVFENANELRLNSPDKTLEGQAIDFIALWIENKVLLKALVDSGRLDILQQAHKKYLAPFKDRYFPGQELDEIQMEYLLTTLTYCIPTFLVIWVENGEKENAVELFQRLKKCFHMLGEIFN